MVIPHLRRQFSSAASGGLRNKSRKSITDSVSSYLGRDTNSRAALKRAELEKNMVPRAAVLHLLGKKGLWNWRVPSLHSMFRISEKNFKERFVDRYTKDVPKLMETYQGKVNFKDFESIEGKKYIA